MVRGPGHPPGYKILSVFCLTYSKPCAIMMQNFTQRLEKNATDIYVIAQGQGHGLLFQLKILFSEINIRNLVYTCTYYSFLSALKPGGGGGFWNFLLYQLSSNL